MAIWIRLVDDAANVVDLNTASATTTEYVPSSSSGDTTDDSVTFDVPLAQWDTLRTAVEAMIQRAKDKQKTGIGPVVYLSAKRTDASQYFNSEILDGSIELSSEWDMEQVSGWVTATISVTRVNYWEDSNELSSGPMAVTNASPFADFTPSTGLECRANVRVTNTYSSIAGSLDVRVGRVVRYYSSAIAPLLDANSGNNHSGGGGSVSGVSFVGGQALNLNWTDPNERIVWSTALGKSFLDAAGGQDYVIMANVRSTSGGIRIRATIATDDGLSGLIERWPGINSQATTNTAAWYTLGRVQLPLPTVAAYGANNVQPLRLRLHASTFGVPGARAIQLDYVLMMPARDMRTYRCHSFRIDQNTHLNDVPYGREGSAVYSGGWGGGNLDNYIAEGAPIMLTPGHVNTFAVAVWPPDDARRSSTLTITYKPRRRTI